MFPLLLCDADALTAYTETPDYSRALASIAASSDERMCAIGYRADRTVIGEGKYRLIPYDSPLAEHSSR